MKRALLLMLILIVAGCTHKSVEINTGTENIKINVEIADSLEEKTRGLMFRENLCENCGMLFVYDDSRIRNFWMKNTLIPLDIIFISEDFKILNIEKAEPCKEDPCKIYSSKRNAEYVLEVNSEFTFRNNIKEGDYVAIKKGATSL